MYMFVLTARPPTLPELDMFMESGHVFAETEEEAKEKVLKNAKDKYPQYYPFTHIWLNYVEDEIIIRAYEERMKKNENDG